MNKKLVHEGIKNKKVHFIIQITNSIKLKNIFHIQKIILNLRIYLIGVKKMIQFMLV